MKMVLAFIIGVIFTICTTVMISGPVLNAESEDFELADLLPDIGKIYREALVTPFQEVEPEIYDEDIADYYHKLTQKCGLDQPVSE